MSRVLTGAQLQALLSSSNSPLSRAVSPLPARSAVQPGAPSPVVSHVTLASSTPLTAPGALTFSSTLAASRPAAGAVATGIGSTSQRATATRPVRRRAAGTRAASPARVPGSHVRVEPAPPAGSVISRIVRVVPEGVWIALAAALALASVGGLAAVASGLYARRRGVAYAEMSAAAVTDPLTGILNRRGFTEAAERELARARRYGRPFALAYVDVRGLKTVNDSQGHLVGDQLIRQAAELLQESARANDVVGRLGGDEMGLLLVEQSSGGAAAVRQRINAAVAQRRPAIGIDGPWDLTIGTAAFPEDGKTVEELLKVADRRLYEQRGIALS